jgi:transposase
MHDNAPGHSGELTVEELESRGIRVLVWPPFSPNLNPIETVRDKIKDYIAFDFPEKMSYDRLRMAVKEAWEKDITEEYLLSLLEGM